MKESLHFSSNNKGTVPNCFGVEDTIQGIVDELNEGINEDTISPRDFKIDDSDSKYLDQRTNSEANKHQHEKKQKQQVTNSTISKSTNGKKRKRRNRK